MQRGVRLAEVVASLCLATDLATGQPLEHGLRRTLLAVWLGQDLGLRREDLNNVYFVALLGSAGCILDGAALASFVQDEIAMREQMVALDPGRPLQVAAFFVRTAGAGRPPLRRIHNVLTLPSEAQVVCRDVALHVGRLLDLGEPTREALGQCDETWNGKGGPLHLQGEAISLPARLFILANDAEVFHRAGGAEAAVAMVRRRSGTAYDPRLAARFCAAADDLLRRLQAEPVWDAVLAEEPAPYRMLSSTEVDEVATKIGSFVDMRSAYTVGHSQRVASLAEAAARAIGLSRTDAQEVRLAGLLHDLGRSGVPVTAWDKPGRPSPADWERMRRHPSLTELVLSRSSSLGHLGTLAGLHHERIDGSGYRGVSAASLPVTARVLAVADTYETKREPRPHRERLTAEAAADELCRQANARALDPDVVAAVLAAVGQQPAAAPTKRQWPAGLSDREVEVLRLAIRGMSNRQIADSLVISPKTVGRHLERIYDKAGVSSRVGATMFAVEHDLVVGDA